MLKEFKKFIAAEKLFSPKEKILLAVSGGKDSAVMAELFRQAGYTYGIAHCNFQLRADESEKDELFVAALAKNHKVPFYTKRFPAAQTAKKNGISVQMAARDLRYSWFSELLETENYCFVATAHHLDDQVETFFINLMRGTGIAGFHGILPKQGKVIRPMLFTFRENIDIFSRENNIPFREDKSNNETKYLRNKIRHEILPVLREIHPEFSVNLNENILKIREIETIFREAVEKKRKRLVKREKEVSSISIEEIKKLNPAGTYMYEFLSPFGFNFYQVKDLLKALDSSSGKILLSNTHRLVKDRDYIFITPKTKSPAKGETGQLFLVQETASTIRQPIKLSFEKVNKDQEFLLDPSPQMAFLDLRKISYPLLLRKWQHGDTFYPFGRNNRKKLSDYFIDEKFSLLDKEDTWVLCCGKEIVWIVGHRIDNRLRISSKTKEVLKIRWSK